MATRIAIMGSGAIGSIVGGMLTRTGHDVTLIDQWPEHVEVMKRDGLHLSIKGNDYTIPVNALNIGELPTVQGSFDLAFISMKSYDTEWATMLMRSYLSSDGLVVDLQNGINDDRVAEIIGGNRTLGCVITMGAGMYEPGHVIRTDSRDIGFRVGEFDGSNTSRVNHIAEIMSNIEGTIVTDNLWGERWGKLAVNCMANPIAGLTGFGGAEVRINDTSREIAIHLAAEVIKVGMASGHELGLIWGIEAQQFLDAADGKDSSTLKEKLIKQSTALGEGRPSFLQDVMRGRRTEIDYLNGYVSERGREVGIPTPVNDAVVEIVHSFPIGKIEPDPDNLEKIRKRLPSGFLNTS